MPFAVIGVFTLGTVLAVVSARDFAKAVDDDPHQAPNGDWPAVPTFRDTNITDIQVPVEGRSSPFNGTAPAVAAGDGRGPVSAPFHGEAV